MKKVLIAFSTCILIINYITKYQKDKPVGNNPNSGHAPHNDHHRQKDKFNPPVNSSSSAVIASDNTRQDFSSSIFQHSIQPQTSGLNTLVMEAPSNQLRVQSESPVPQLRITGVQEFDTANLDSSEQGRRV